MTRKNNKKEATVRAWACVAANQMDSRPSDLNPRSIVFQLLKTKLKVEHRTLFFQVKILVSISFLEILRNTYGASSLPDLSRSDAQESNDRRKTERTTQDVTKKNRNSLRFCKSNLASGAYRGRQRTEISKSAQCCFN